MKMKMKETIKPGRVIHFLFLKRYAEKLDSLTYSKYRDLDKNDNDY
jgi:hypothetical protein